MLPEEKYEELLQELDDCANPLFFYDDDPDGLSSFLILSRYKKDGIGVYVKSVPRLTKEFLVNIEKYQPDKIFILDMPNVDEEFFRGTKVPIVWVDHHKHEYQPNYVKSINPHDFPGEADGMSTTEICYRTVKQDLWIAAVGSIGDWTLPDFLDEFSDKYPDLLSKGITNPPQALFDEKISEIIDIFSMILKIHPKSIGKAIPFLRKMKDPYELLGKETEGSKYIHKKIKPMLDEYKQLIDSAMTTEAEDDAIIYLYEANKFGFSKEISNYLQYKNPDKLIIVGRATNGEYKLSLRCQKCNLVPVINQALTSVDGYGGGHEHACGSCVAVDYIDIYLENIKRLVKETQE